MRELELPHGGALATAAKLRRPQAPRQPLQSSCLKVLGADR